MKSIGILFSTPMVIADLKNLKTMTRRTRGLNKINESPDDWVCEGLQKYPDVYKCEPFWQFRNKNISEYSGERLRLLCPYGGIGDEIWLRETWAVSSFSANFAKEQQLQIAYKAGVFALDRDMTHDLEWRTVDYETWKKYAQPKYYSWHSSMFMPRWASRRKHILTDIRCERVKQITACDCVKEGLSTKFREHDAKVDLVEQYSKLWDSLNGKKYPWNKNVWVWVLEWEK